MIFPISHLQRHSMAHTCFKQYSYSLPELKWGGIIAGALHRITLIRFLTMLSNEGTLFVPADASATLKILVHCKILQLVEIYLKVLISLMLSLWRSYIFRFLWHYLAYLACIGLFCVNVTINTWKKNFFYIEQYLSIPKWRHISW